MLDEVVILDKAGIDRSLSFYRVLGLVIISRRFDKVIIMKNARLEQVVKLTRKSGLLRTRDLDPHQIPRLYLSLACRKGLIKRLGRGLYVASDREVTEHFSLASANKRVPHGVICLLSALRFHGLTTQNPFEVWMAIDEKARLPRVDNVQLRVVRFSGPALSEGIEEHQTQGVPMKVYSVAKTVADCFKYRNKVGLDVAIEALRESRRGRRATNDDLWRFAKICRVARIMKPYMEAVT